MSAVKGPDGGRFAQTKPLAVPLFTPLGGPILSPRAPLMSVVCSWDDTWRRLRLETMADGTRRLSRRFVSRLVSPTDSFRRLPRRTEKNRSGNAKTPRRRMLRARRRPPAPPAYGSMHHRRRGNVSTRVVGADIPAPQLRAEGVLRVHVGGVDGHASIGRRRRSIFVEDAGMLGGLRRLEKALYDRQDAI